MYPKGITRPELIKKIGKQGIGSKTTAEKYIKQLIEEGRIRSIDGLPNRYTLPVDGMKLEELDESILVEIEKIETKITSIKNIKKYHSTTKEHMLDRILPDINKKLQIIEEIQSSTTEESLRKEHNERLEILDEIAGSMYKIFPSDTDELIKKDIEDIRHAMDKNLKRQFELIRKKRNMGGGLQRKKVTETIKIMDKKYYATFNELFDLEQFVDEYQRSDDSIEDDVRYEAGYNNNIAILDKFVKSIKEFKRKTKYTIEHESKSTIQNWDEDDMSKIESMLEKINKDVDTVRGEITKMYVGEERDKIRQKIRQKITSVKTELMKQ